MTTFIPWALLPSEVFAYPWYVYAAERDTDSPYVRPVAIALKRLDISFEYRSLSVLSGIQPDMLKHGQSLFQHR